MKNQAIVLAIALSAAQASASGPNATQVFKQVIGNQVLHCQILESGQYQPAPPLVDLQIQADPSSGQDAITTTAQYEGDRYEVNDASIRNGTLIIDLGNDTDGPLSQDRLELQLGSLSMLSENPNFVIHGADHYSEQLDGTSTVLPMDCHLGE